MGKIKHLDLFCGIGGFRLGLKQACEKRGVGYECVFSSDISKKACVIYEKNFGDYPKGDISKIDAKEFPDFNVLTAGFPCQPFSIAGKRKGFNDTRGTLFFEIMRIAKERRPRLLFLENVKGLVTHDNGNTWRIIQKELRAANYFYHAEVLNSLYYGVPQHRQRIFIIAFRDKKDYEFFDFPKPTTEKFKTIAEILAPEQVKITDFLPYKHAYKALILKYNNRLCDINGFCGCLQRADSSSAIFDFDFKKQNFKKNGEPNFQLRAFNGRELARLQGYPDNFYYLNSRRANTAIFGNSVTVNVIQAIFENVLKSFVGEPCPHFVHNSQYPHIPQKPFPPEIEKRRLEILKELNIKDFRTRKETPKGEKLFDF